MVLEKTDYDVLNVVALKKMAAADVIVAASGVDRAEVEAALGRLAEQDLVAMAGGMALPTDDAVPALEETAAEQYATVRSDPAVLTEVDRFEAVNSQFLVTMSAWQQVDVGGRKVTNDHQDPEYDGKIIDRLDNLVTRLESLLGALGGHDPHFARYSSRFAAAMETVDQGQHDFVSSPMVDSVHNIWFEFHEDLLRTLGRERAE